MRLNGNYFAKVNITSNLDLPQWYDLFQRKPLVDASLDRLQHHCVTIRIDGPSLRGPTATPTRLPRSTAPTKKQRPASALYR